MIKLPEKVIKDASTFLQRLLGPAVEAADLLGDKIRIIRFENAIRIINRAQKICEEEKVEVKNVPLNFIIPFLEQASLQDDEKVTEIWARLLTNASNDYDPILIVIKDSLTRLSGREISLIKDICSYEDFDYDYDNFSGDVEKWLNSQHNELKHYHNEIAKQFESFPNQKKEDKQIDEYLDGFKKFMALPLNFEISPDFTPGMIKYYPFISSEYTSSVQILRNTGILEKEKIRIWLPKGKNIKSRNRNGKEKTQILNFQKELSKQIGCKLLHTD